MRWEVYSARSLKLFSLKKKCRKSFAVFAIFVVRKKKKMYFKDLWKKLSKIGLVSIQYKKKTQQVV